MDTDLLVADRIEDGRTLLAELSASGFAVGIAFWVKTVEEQWYLFIGSPTEDPVEKVESYRTLRACYSKIPDPAFGLSTVKFVPITNPVAADALAARNKRPGRLPIRLRDRKLGNIEIQEAYIYPRMEGPMLPGEILHSLVGIASRSPVPSARPSVITLRGGNKVTRYITGFNVQMPGGLTIDTIDPSSNVRSQIAGDEVFNIQF